MKSITIESLTKVYEQRGGGVRAVDGVSLQIEAGEFFFLLGPSGCGKTTLLRMIAGLIEPSSGRILFGDRDVTGLSVEKRNTAMVFQNYALWPHMSVARNVRFGPKMRGADSAEQDRRMTESLQRVQMLDYQKRRPNQLSGGQQQRVALARALAARPDCLLLDEPLSNLDARLRLHMRSQLRQLVKETGTTGVYVTHDQKEALSMADRIAVMDAGRIVQVDTPQQLYLRPATRFVADFLGEANFIDGTLRGQAVETAAGTIAVADSGGLADGAAVTCCIRPEQIEAVEAGESGREGGPGLPATVESVTFLGEVRQLVCRVAGTDLRWRITALARSAHACREGEAVQLTMNPTSVVLLPRA